MEDMPMTAHRSGREAAHPEIAPRFVDSARTRRTIGAMRNVHAGAALMAAAALIGLGAQAALAQSLYNEATFKSLTADRRAVKPGDSVTVLVMENSSATASANTTTQKTGGIMGGIKTNSVSHTGAITLGEDFGGKGTVQRAGRVVAQLTVTVHSVAANDEMYITGRQNILVNGEKQLIELSGRIRPIDISEANTIVSNRIADAQITYVGDGILAEKQKQGILTHILGWLGLL
jgi:flagellar L-ring protein precursor FlgH